MTRARRALAEGIGTGAGVERGLLAAGVLCSTHRKDAVAYAVACYIVAAYGFTAPTSFANPAVTIAQAFTDSFTGIAPASVPGFLAAQLFAAVVAALLVRAEPN